MAHPYLPKSKPIPIHGQHDMNDVLVFFWQCPNCLEMHPIYIIRKTTEHRGLMFKHSTLSGSLNALKCDSCGWGYDHTPIVDDGSIVGWKPPVRRTLLAPNHAA